MKYTYQHLSFETHSRTCKQLSELLRSQRADGCPSCSRSGHRSPSLSLLIDITQAVTAATAASDVNEMSTAVHTCLLRGASPSPLSPDGFPCPAGSIQMPSSGAALACDTGLGPVRARVPRIRRSCVPPLDKVINSPQKVSLRTSSQMALKGVARQILFQVIGKPQDCNHTSTQGLGRLRLLSDHTAA